MVNNIDSIVNFIIKANKLVWGFVTNILPAIIALIGTGFTIHYTKKNSINQIELQKELNTKQQNFQKEIRALNEKHLTNLKNKELSANIIAKQRIDWLQNVRNATSDFISSYYELMNDFMSKVTEKEHKEHLKEYNKNYHLLCLYYPTKDDKGVLNDDHDILVKKLEALDKEVKYIAKKHKINFDNRQISKVRMYEADQALNNFIKESTSYFKYVWEQAKDME